MSKINIDELLKILPKLIRENDTVKGAIISALSGVVATHEDIVELNKNMDKRFERMDKRFERMDKRFVQMDKRFETLVQEMKSGFEEASKEREKLRVSIATISSRSGEKLEELILNMLSEKLLQENIDRSKISRIDLVDQEGQIFYKGYQTDIDVLIDNGKTILMEIKSTADNRDVYLLQKKGELFNLLKEKDYDELMLVCLEINRFNFKQAIQQGVHVIAGEVN